jgi:Phage tail assembly chaperone protein
VEQNFLELPARKIFNMKKYCYIENNEIVLINQDLPVNWKNISNFYALPDSVLKTYGWLPLVIETENKPVFVSSSYVIEEDKVREIIITRDKTPEELQEEENKEIEMQWYQIRNQRDDLLKQSDLLVLVDKWETYSPERQNEIRNYRQALRDLPQNFQDPSEVIWPELS